MVRVHNTGAVTVYSGTSPHGQGLDTAFAQIVADKVGVDPAVVEVSTGIPRRSRGPQHVRVTLAGHRRRGDRPGHRQDGDEGQGDRRRRAQAAPEDIEVSDGKFSVRGSPDKGMALAECRDRLHRCRSRGHGAGSRGADVLRPRELRVPVRRPRLRGRRRRGDREDQGRAVRCGRRLRARDQPDADRRPGARRRRPRDRAGAVRAHALRRRGPVDDRHVRRLRAADGRRAAELGDRPDRGRRHRSTRSGPRGWARRARSPPGPR